MTSPISFLLILVLLSFLTPTSQTKTKHSSSAKRTVGAQTTPAVSPVKLAEREREIIAEINLARTNPTSYARHLEQYRTYYKGMVINFPDGHGLITNEGLSAVNEAIAFLKSAKALPPMELRAGMVRAAVDHLNDLEKSGKSGHRGSDGSIPEDRLSRYGAWGGSVGEDIVYESRNARDSVIGLIVDDGVKNRGHRQNIFKPGFRVIGIAIGKPAELGTMCVITFAGTFSDKIAGPRKSDQKADIAPAKSAPVPRKY